MTGIDELADQLERLKTEVPEEVTVGLGRAARRVAEETRQDTPVRTGRAKAGLQGATDPWSFAVGPQARITSTGTPSAYFHASEEHILEHDAEGAAVDETAKALERVLKRTFR